MTIPPELRDFETYIISYSGGKDSTATALWCLEHLPHSNLHFVFCDTGAEWPETYEYLRYIEGKLGIKIKRLQAGDIPLPPRVDGKPRQDIMHSGRSLFELIRLRGKWPGPRYRYCTTYLKRWPLRLFAAQYPNSLQIDGCRAEESKRRANYPWLDKSGYNQVSSPFLPPSPPVCHPILGWSEKQVWDCLRAHRVLPNAVYNHATRCGCWCCCMGRPVEIFNFCRLHPDIAQKAADLEREIDYTWREQHSITNLLWQAQAQLPLFER